MGLAVASKNQAFDFSEVCVCVCVVHCKNVKTGTGYLNTAAVGFPSLTL